MTVPALVLVRRTVIAIAMLSTQEPTVASMLVQILATTTADATMGCVPVTSVSLDHLALSAFARTTVLDKEPVKICSASVVLVSAELIAQRKHAPTTAQTKGCAMAKLESVVAMLGSLETPVKSQVVRMSALTTDDVTRACVLVTMAGMARTVASKCAIEASQISIVQGMASAKRTKHAHALEIGLVHLVEQCHARKSVPSMAFA